MAALASESTVVPPLAPAGVTGRCQPPWKNTNWPVERSKSRIPSFGAANSQFPAW